MYPLFPLIFLSLSFHLGLGWCKKVVIEHQTAHQKTTTATTTQFMWRKTTEKNYNSACTYIHMLCIVMKNINP